MPTTSALQAVPLPINADAPLIPSNMLTHVQYMEKRLVMRFTDTAQRDSIIPAGQREAGMVVYLTTTKVFMYYDGTTWLNLVATIQSPVIAPVDAINSGGQITLVGAGSNKSWGIKQSGGALMFRHDMTGTPIDIMWLGVQGMYLGTGMIFQREGVNQPVIRSGSAAPSNGVGVDGDVYLQWA